MAIKRETWHEQSRRMTLHHEVFKFARAFKENFVTLMISSAGFLVALSWNNFWNSWISTFSVESSITYKLIIAVSMTALAVVLTYVFSRLKGNGS